MSTLLEGLKVMEVSGVDRAANRRTFLLTKADGADTEGLMVPLRKAWDVLSGLFGVAKMDEDAPKDFSEAYAEAEAERLEWAKTEKLWPIYQALRESVTACLLDETMTDHRAAVTTCMQQALDAIAALGLLDPPAVLKAMAAFQAQTEPIFKAADKADVRRTKLLGKMKVLLDEMMADMSSETPAVKVDMKEDQPMADAVGAVVAPVTKTDLEALQKSVNDLKTENEKLVKAANDAADLAKAEVDRRETAEAIAKAEKDMPNVPGTTPKDLGPVLKRAQNALLEADYNLIEKALTASSAAIKGGNLLTELGTSGGGAAGTAAGQLEGLAKAAQAANPSLSYAAAYSQALTNNPALYTQYQAEKPKG